MGAFSSQTTTGLMQGGSLGMSVVGSYFSAAAKRSQLQADADIADINAAAAERSAQSALLSSEREAQSIQLKTAGLKGAQRAAMGANGIDMTSGTAQAILTSTDYLGESDVNTAVANGMRSAWGYRAQGTNFENQARSARAGAGSISPFMAGATTLLSESTKVAASNYALEKATKGGPELDKNDALGAWMKARGYL